MTIYNYLRARKIVDKRMRSNGWLLNPKYFYIEFHFWCGDGLVFRDWYTPKNRAGQIYRFAGYVSSRAMREWYHKNDRRDNVTLFLELRLPGEPELRKTRFKEFEDRRRSSFYFRAKE